MQGQLDLSFGQVQLEPHLSIRQVKFTIFFLTLVKCSFDPFPAVLLKEYLDLPTLCRIVNLSLESGQLPYSLKTAVLSLLLKKPSLDHELLGNYKPISNLKVISKIIEKVVALRLQDYLHGPSSRAFTMTFFCKLIIVTIYMLYSFCLTCLLILTLSTTISCLKDLTLGSQFVVLLLTGFGHTLNRTQFALIDGKKSTLT